MLGCYERVQSNPEEQLNDEGALVLAGEREESLHLCTSVPVGQRGGYSCHQPFQSN